MVTAHLVPKPPHVAPPTREELRTIEAANEELERRIVRNHLLYGHAALDLYLQASRSGCWEEIRRPPAWFTCGLSSGADANAFSLFRTGRYM